MQDMSTLMEKNYPQKHGFRLSKDNIITSFLFSRGCVRASLLSNLDLLDKITHFNTTSGHNIKAMTNVIHLIMMDWKCNLLLQHYGTTGLLTLSHYFSLPLLRTTLIINSSSTLHSFMFWGNICGKPSVICDKSFENTQFCSWVFVLWI